MQLTKEEQEEFRRLFEKTQQGEQRDGTHDVIHCHDCRFFGRKYHRCGIYIVDKTPDGFCDEAIARGRE